MYFDIAKTIIYLLNDKLLVKCIRKLVRKSYTPVVPIANTCSIGYPHDGRADNAAYHILRLILPAITSSLHM